MPYARSHTRSRSGRTHQLTINGTVVTLRYRTAPQFDDQVEGDLVRKYWAEGGTVSPIGPIGCRYDDALDLDERERELLTPEQIATATINASGHWADDAHATIHRLIATAIRADRTQQNRN